MSKESKANQPPVDETPEIEPWVLEKLESILERQQEHERLFDEKLLGLIGLMCVRFNLLERDFKFSLSILRRDHLPLRRAYAEVLKIQRFKSLLEEVRKIFSARFSDPIALGEFEQLIQEADDLRRERNLMLHSVWRSTSDPEKPFVREKHDEDQTEVDFDIPTVQRLVNRLGECRKRTWKFFNEQIPGYASLEEELWYSPVWKESTGPGVVE
jgi:hypothetical protein